MHFARVFYSNAEDDSNASMESRAVTSEKRGKEAVRLETKNGTLN